ncbi:MAG: HAD-IB family hydrolase [Acidimicrobiia bacterium]|nr:HAD-IB family hydrolase [Acidimicrobiia bacterium]
MTGAAAFFDLDKTIIAKSSTLAFTRHLFQAGFLTRRSLVKAGIAQMYYSMFGADHDQVERVRAELSELTKGWDRDEVIGLVEETVEETVSPLVYAEALAIIAEHHRAGRRVVVISSSPVEIVEPLCRHLGIDEVIGTRPEIKDGKYTGAIEFYAYGPGKAEAIRQLAESDNIDLSESFAYTDSATDLPMLETVGHPVAVNPDKALAAIAKSRDWQVLHFDRPVISPKRSGIDPKPVIAGSLIAGGVAALTVWAMKGRKG